MSNGIVQSSTQDSSSSHSQEDNQTLYQYVYDTIKKEVDSKFEELRPTIDDKIDGMVGEFKIDIQSNIKETKNELNQVKNNVINTLAIFAAFFTFISTSFNLFSSNISIFSALSLLVILWLLLIGFAYLVGVFVSREHNHIKTWIPIIILAALTCVILFFNYNNNPQATNEKTIERLSVQPKQNENNSVQQK